MREAKKAAERRQRTASIDSDIQIEEQLKNVRLDGEKSPLTSPTRRDGKRATNASKGSAGDADTATEDQRRRRNALAIGADLGLGRGSGSRAAS